MPDLNFEVIGSEVPPYAAVPTLIFKLRIDNASEQEHIHSVMLRSQVQIAATRRRYTPEEQARLLEVFGEPHRWSDSLRPLLWTHANLVVPQFSGSTTVDMPIPCTYDFEVVAAKYFSALDEGEIPLTFLFSGTIFYEGTQERLQVEQISWSKESSYRLSLALWQEMIERYYPNSAFIRLQKDVFDQLYRYKATRSLPTWDDVIARLLATTDEGQGGKGR